MKKLIFLSLLFFFHTAAYGQNYANLIEKTEEVSLVFTGPAEGLNESSFGHLALRLSHSKEPTLKDMVIEFVADIPEDEPVLKKYFKGIGVAFPYPVASKVHPFYEFKKIKQIEEGRDVTLMDLELTREEIKNIIDVLLNRSLNFGQEDYSFLVKNCSYFAVHVIEKAIGKKIPYKSFPWKVQESLSNADRLGEVFTYRAAPEKRAEILLGQQKRRPFLMSEKEAQISAEMLKHRDFLFRKGSYLKLLAFQDKDREAAREARSLIRRLKALESPVNKDAINLLGEKDKKKEIIALPKRHYQGRILKRKVDHQLDVENGEVFLKLKWAHILDGQLQSRVRRRFRVERERVRIPQVRYHSKTGNLSFKGEVVGQYLESQNLDFILSQMIDYGIEVDQENKTFRPYFYVKRSSNRDPKMPYDVFKETGTLALNNRTDFSGSGGTCYAMLVIQKSLLQRARFIPSAPQLKYESRLKAIEETLKGNYVAIPGFEGIHDFTSSIKKEELMAYVSKKQSELQSHSLVQMYKNFNNLEEINASSIQTLKRLTDAGAFVTVAIGMLEKGERRLASQAGHTILVFDVEETENGEYQLLAYDPNTGVNKLFEIDESFYFHHPFFSNEYDFIGGMMDLGQESLELDMAVRTRGFKESLLSFRVKSGNLLVIPRYQVFHFLN